MDVKVVWTGEGLLHSALSKNGTEVQLASGLDQSDVGFSPMELIAAGLGGCSAMDVLSILQKKHQDVKGIEVLVHTEAQKEHPRVWSKVTIEYLIKGDGIDPVAVERAMELAYEKYCPAQNMIKQVVEIELTYKIIPSKK